LTAITDPNIAKLSRYPALMQKLVDYLAGKMAEIMNLFRSEAQSELDLFKMDTKVVKSSFHVKDGKIVVQLAWSRDIESIMSDLTAMWFSHVFMDLPAIVREWEMPPSQLKEDCKADRMNVLQKMVTVTDSINSLINLEIKVKYSGLRIPPGNFAWVLLLYLMT
jgi:hypothetical protein